MTIAVASLVDFRKLVLGMDYKDVCCGVPMLSAAPVNGALATKTFGTTNTVTLTAKTDTVAAGVLGNGYSMEWLDPSGNSKALSVALSGKKITVNLATSSEGAITSTPTTIATALAADEDIAALFTITDSRATQNNAVIAVAETALAGGADCTYGEVGWCGIYGTYLYIAVDTKDEVDDTIWRRISIGTAY